MVKKFESGDEHSLRRLGDREQVEQQAKREKMKVPKYTRSMDYAYMSDETRIETLHKLASFFYERPLPSCDGQAYSKYCSMHLIPIQIGQSGRVIVTRLVDILLPFSQPILGFEVFEKFEPEHTMVFCFRLRSRFSFAKADAFFSFALMFAFTIVQKQQYFYFSRIGTLSASLVKQVNQEVTTNSSVADTSVWIYLEKELTKQGYYTWFKWFPTLVKSKTAAGAYLFVPGMELDSVYASTSQSEYDSLLGTVSSSVKRFVINDLFKAQMTAVGEYLFGRTTGCWLRVQQFSSPTGGLQPGLESRTQFKLFISSFDAQRLAYMTFDSYTASCYTEARSRLDIHLRQLLDSGNQTVSMKVLPLREEFYRIWLPMIDASLLEYVSTLNSADHGIFQENHGLLQRLIKFSEVVCSAPVLKMTELDHDTLANISVFGFYLLTWCRHSAGSSKMSLVIQGVSGGGKSLLVGILSGLCGFAPVDFKGVSMFQNAEVGSAAGFVAEELDLTPGNIDLLKALRDWGAWVDKKLIRIKHGSNVWTKQYSPFVSSTNHDLDDWLTSFLSSRSTQTIGTANSLRRRYSVIEVLNSNVSHAYSNHLEVMASLETSIARLALTFAVICYGAEFAESVRVYEYTSIFVTPVDQQPLQKMFKDLLSCGSKSEDFVLKALCDGGNQISATFIRLVRQAVDTSRTSIEQREVMRQKLKDCKKGYVEALNSMFSTQFQSISFMFGGMKVTTNVTFDGTGFAGEQKLFVDSGSALGEHDPQILVKHDSLLTFVEKMNRIKFIECVRNQNMSVQTGVFEWIAYLIRIDRSMHQQVVGEATQISDPQKSERYHYRLALQQEEESKVPLPFEVSEIENEEELPFSRMVTEQNDLIKPEKMYVETSLDKDIIGGKRFFEESFGQQQHFEADRGQRFYDPKMSKVSAFEQETFYRDPYVQMTRMKPQMTVGQNDTASLGPFEKEDSNLEQLNWCENTVLPQAASSCFDASSQHDRPEMSSHVPADYLSVRHLATSNAPNCIQNLGSLYDSQVSCVEELFEKGSIGDY